MNAQQRRLFVGLVGALAERFSDQGHPMQMATNERLGYCTVKGCAPSCRALVALLIEASEVLEAELREPEQIGLFGEAAG